MGPRVREATPDDADGIAVVHVAGWRWAYVGIVPQAYLDGLDVARRAAAWRSRLEAPHPGSRVFVVHADGRVAGFVSTCDARDPDRLGLAELAALYVDPAHVGLGLGRALASHALADLGAGGRRDVSLWVLADNARARRFYTRAGFEDDGAEKNLELGGAVLREVRMCRRSGGHSG